MFWPSERPKRRFWLESLSRHAAEVLPDHFQVVLEVDMIDVGDEVINVSSRPKTHRVIPTGRQADSS
jgi:ATP:corrinoid adenosyltransferase